MSETRARAAIPHAAALSCAVKDDDAAEVERILTRLSRNQLYALAVVLAAHVDIEAPLDPRLIPGDACGTAVTHAAAYFGLDPDVLLSRSRTREATRARMVAMAVARRTGRTTVEIGQRFERDHTTVIYATERCNHDAELALAVERIHALIAGGADIEDDAA